MKWENKKVKDVCELAYGKSLIASSRINGEYPVYGSAGEVGTHNQYLVEGPGIIIGRKGSVGTIYYEKRNFFPIDTSYYVIPKANNDLRFLYYIFQTLGLCKLNSDAAIPGLNRNVAYEQTANYPQLHAQHKIASILSAYDDLIENNLKRIKLLEENMFASYNILVKRENNWEKTPIGKLATVTSSKRIFLSDYVDEGIPFYRSKEIIAKSKFESIKNPLYISEVKYSEIKEKFGVPQTGDFLITAVGTIGFVHLVNDDEDNFYFKDGNLIWIRNLIQPNLKYFLFFTFRTPEFRDLLNSVAIGSSQKALTIETVKKLTINIPTHESLIEFNETAKTSINFIYNLQKQNTKLREAKDILLPRLMSGEIEVI
jgi:restriction endonuclease S subunit